jgi:hypothetical protein
MLTLNWIQPTFSASSRVFRHTQTSRTFTIGTGLQMQINHAFNPLEQIQSTRELGKIRSPFDFVNSHNEQISTAEMRKRLVSAEKEEK